MNFDYKQLIKPEMNIGEKEKKIRLISGGTLFLVSVITASIFLLLLALALIATGYNGWCPAYSALGRNSTDSNT
ncbi:MAG TPA: DUF2892 domain-containing protein [Methylococcaceae bacterium]|jgi:hypothetical protein|nr:DUF2892 domain-containing protein [Methylococcaceae bacterium]HIN68829.1 DUF2892 domain-containing protein [Methylococcales bacterium]HIA45839.1 DUF2892 domain-containing protein [Methylococcaceae bacterium]HIB62573.1 DUF2892 domain-containing protein [Methylococcaceae bacterium]HIO13518.1 DUF2892 domain-containing protein [Methylococcales bacterium]